MTKKVVLKEYCAEIESLKQMLQITREKNGVYVDPVVFEQMEARLSSQEGLIAECESALRVRTEEVKNLKETVEEVGGRLEEAQGQLQETESKLEETEGHLTAARDEVAFLKVGVCINSNMCVWIGNVCVEGVWCSFVCQYSILC